MSAAGQALTVRAGESILMDSRLVVVTAVERHGVRVRNAAGEESTVQFPELRGRAVGGDRVAAVHHSLEPWWSGLSQPARDEALWRLEVVMEVLTGYRCGMPELAQDGEPFPPFGPESAATLDVRFERMAELLSHERTYDRKTQKRVARGELATSAVSKSTIRNWVQAWQSDGLPGLVDKRRTRPRATFENIDPAIKDVVREVLSDFDGSASTVNITEIRRRIDLRIRAKQLDSLRPSDRLLRGYVTRRYGVLGKTTRAQRASRLREQRGHVSYPDVHPGHLAVDVTRSDVLVWDEVGERSYSVEIITVMSVPTRVIVACRVVPQSANTTDAALALYDAMRPLSMRVDGTGVDDFRWCGIPESLDFGNAELRAHVPRVRTDRQLTGTHIKPGVTPKSIRADNGSIFISTELRSVLARFGVDLLTSRPGHPTDNAHLERWHETLQRALQALPGYKGRNVQERGRNIGQEPTTPLLTARELERHLHRFIALDYHRTPHAGIKVPGVEGGRFTPLERFDMLAANTGRILVPQHPDLIFDFLPIRWLTPQASGVAFKGLYYDGPILDELRDLSPRAFRSRDDKVPFFYDPRDASRLWHRSRHDGRIHELRWRQAHLIDAPMTDGVLERARQLLRERGGNSAVRRDTAGLEIAHLLTELTSVPTSDEWKRQLGVARLRHEQARRDHEERLHLKSVVEGAHPDAPMADVHSIRTEATEEATWDAPWPDYRTGEI